MQSLSMCDLFDQLRSLPRSSASELATVGRAQHAAVTTDKPLSARGVQWVRTHTLVWSAPPPAAPAAPAGRWTPTNADAAMQRSMSADLQGCMASGSGQEEDAPELAARGGGGGDGVVVTLLREILSVLHDLRDTPHFGRSGGQGKRLRPRP